MRKAKFLAVFTLLTASLTASADNGQVVTVNGKTVAKTVTKMTFDGDNVLLVYSDNTTETVDMANVSVVFTVADAIKALETEALDAPVSYFDLNGRQLKQAPQQGAYVMKKGNSVVKILQK
ncbi:MAG: hypothetical protein IJ544_06320 [Prevotella sp.]|nr:hypothetical protein [Prevotella sp.]